MELTWTIGIIGWIVALLAGGGGVALIHRLFVRPRVYYKAGSWRLVPLREELRQQRAEEVLRQEGLPTAVAEVKWWNAGRRTAEDLSVEVTVPGEIVDFRIEPDDADDISAPWEVARLPVDFDHGRGLRITQPELKRGGEVRVTVGYRATEGEQDPPEIDGFFGEREIPNVDAPVRRVWLPLVPVGLLMLGMLVWMGHDVIKNAESVPGGLGEVLGGLALSVAIAVVFIIIIRGWAHWVETTIRKPPSEVG